MNNKVNIENIILAERIRLGVQKVLRKLAVESAAKELLMNLPK
ncbi:hypothetical protein [Sphingobacterium paramultivorum]|nr:hypothetical protein [Sphingobacterium paramultivorum]WSO15968.1 hypothetical protein VUL84_05355 [Sphingobacterium paramultivorum]